MKLLQHFKYGFLNKSFGSVTAVGPATVTKDKQVFKSALNIVRVYGGGNCPEKSLTGILMALKVSKPRSFIYVFTDATASDHKLVGSVLDSIQKMQSQVSVK